MLELVQGIELELVQEIELELVQGIVLELVQGIVLEQAAAEAFEICSNCARAAAKYNLQTIARGP